MLRNARPKEALRSEINVAPLVDVVLVLLIIFMVVTPLLDGLRVPETEKPERFKRKDDAPPVKLMVSWPEKKVFVDGTWVADELLVAQLREAHRKRRDAVLAADRQLAFADVKPALRALREAGYEGAGLVATPEARSLTGSGLNN